MCSTALELFREAKINYLSMSRGVNHNILWLDVPEDNIVAVEVADSLGDFRDIKQTYIVREASAFGQSAKQLSTWNVLEKHVHSFCVVEGCLAA